MHSEFICTITQAGGENTAPSEVLLWGDGGGGRGEVNDGTLAGEPVDLGRLPCLRATNSLGLLLPRDDRGRAATESGSFGRRAYQTV